MKNYKICGKSFRPQCRNLIRLSLVILDSNWLHNVRIVLATLIMDKA